MRFEHTVEKPSIHNRRVKRNAIKHKLKQKRKHGFAKGAAVYDSQIGIITLKERVK